MKHVVNKFVKRFLFCVIAFSLVGCKSTDSCDELAEKFTNLPEEQRMAVYWYWMSDNISVDGVQKDLEAMKKAGITRAFIGNIWQDDVKPGNVKVLSEEWWEVLHAALKKATELDIEIGIFNCPGWSQSGGPWVKPTQAMRYLKYDTLTVEGYAGKQTIILPSIGAEATDVCVLAYPKTKVGKTTQCQLAKKAGIDLIQDITLNDEKTVRSIVFRTDRFLLVNVEIQAWQDGEFVTIKTEHLNRTNTALNTGFHPYAPICINIPDVKTSKIRFICTGGPSDCLFTADISEEPLVERYEEKSLAKMFQTPLPMWGEYMWPTSAEPKGWTPVYPEEVVDLTKNVSNDTLKWSVPEGEWIVMRCSMTPTGVTNAPASPEATGYEVDKMSREHVAAHFDAFLGEILRRIPAKDRKAFKVVVEDSYETGGQNWTDDMIEQFEARYNYSPIPFIPVLSGKVIGSQDQSERFLWDLRRLVADRVAYDYVGGLREVSHKHGLTTWLENYGHWGFPGEFLQYGGQSDEVGGEFWSEGSLGDIENRAASSCAHIYGKQKVWAESCTSGGPNFHRYPALMKQRTDRFFCEGINATLLHLYIQQPDDETLPGISAPFGNDFQRKNTWFQQMDIFTDYLRRCNLLLQQGQYVADVAYFIGEDAPKMTGECNPTLPRGYSFDYINAEVLHQASVVDGKLTLQSGMQYSVLVLPNQDTMRPEVMNTIANLVRQGLVVLGSQPQRSPSLKNYPLADKEVEQISHELWVENRCGKGRVFTIDSSLDDVFDTLNIKPDCYVIPKMPFSFIHRSLPDCEVYFVANQSDKPQQIPAKFRISGMEAEWWNPVTAERLRIMDYVDDGLQTSITLNLQGNESAFIVFRQKADAALPVILPSEPKVLASIDTPWNVQFQSDMRGPEAPQTFHSLQSWSENSSDSIRYYSGLATYTNTLTLSDLPSEPVYLDLGKVMVMARVYVNDQYAGGAWTPPYRVNVTDLLQQGDNKIRVEVVNNWQNRLIGDSKLPESERRTWTSINHFNANSQLQESGLLGPVRLLGSVSCY